MITSSKHSLRMHNGQSLFTSEQWLENLFDPDQIDEGQIVRRSVELVEWMASADELEKAVRRHQYPLVRMGTQYLILCEPKGRIELIC